ncbi:MAG: hypothetical protein WCJ19_03475 [bacterium]
MYKTKSKYFNPVKKVWEEIEVIIDKKLNFDYSKCKWIALDGEFTGLYPGRDRSALWTICSENENGSMRVEMLYTYDLDADLSIFTDLITSDIEKLFYYGRVDIAYLYQLTGKKIAQPIFDVKLSSVVSRTHTVEHSLKTLVQNYISSTENIIDKTVLFNADWVEDYTKWSDSVIQYNVNDVVYLKFLSDKIKELTHLSGRDVSVDAVNNALPELGVLYSQGFYHNVFKHDYKDTDMQG